MQISLFLKRASAPALIALTVTSVGVGVGNTAAWAQAKPTISVPSFKNETAWWWWNSNTAQELGDSLSNELSATGKFQVVERQKLGAVLSEQELAELGLTKPGTGAKKGNLTGAQYVILGRVTAFEENVSSETSGNSGGINLGIIRIGSGGRKAAQEAYVAIDLRVVDTTTGEVAYSRTVEGRAKSESESNKKEFNFLGINVGSDNAKEKKAPVGKALRAALIESTDYLACVMVKKDACIAQYQAKDDKRRDGTRDVLKLD
jgi:curli biogenesis system outer membrane secretion channel CsgG